MPWVLSPNTIDAIRPRTPRNTFEWISKRIRAPNGKAFNPFDYPWTKGICDAWDDPEVRQITLQFAARLGKTFIANALMISAIEYDPAQGMIGMPTEPLVRDMIRDKYYPMFDKCPDTQDLTPARVDRNQTRIDLMTAVIYGAWAGSTTQLADKAPKYKHGGEVDKWPFDKSDEADPLDLFMERGIEIPDRKSIIESTPSITGKSRVESNLLSGWNARFHVACPLCKKYIQLIEGDGKSIGGVVFDRQNDGTVNIALAKRTARYQCQICSKEWGDEHRRKSIQHGMWVPEGMYIERGKLKGEMIGAKDNASFQLSRIYAPTFTFGDIAGAIAECIIKPGKWQNVRNSWFGLTYDKKRTVRKWNEVGERLAMSYSLATVPEPGVFLTIGIDVQQDCWVFVVCAWGHNGAGWVVDYGNAFSESDVRKVFTNAYKHLDGGPYLRIRIGLMDSGEGIRQDEVVDLCQRINSDRGPWLWPCKGSSGPITGGAPYKQKSFEELDGRKRDHRKRRGVRGFYWVQVNTPHWQAWIQKALHYRKPGEAKSIALPVEAKSDEDFLRQLVNEQPEERSKDTGHINTKWVVVDETVPWDFRDALRYARCAAEIYTRGAWARIPRHRPAGMAKRKLETRPLARESNGAVSTPKQGSQAAPEKQGFIRIVKSRFLQR